MNPPLSYRPITISAETVQDGLRLGGCPPKDVEPLLIRDWSEYFLTLSLPHPDSTLHCSLFFCGNEPEDLVARAGEVPDSELGLVQAVFHDPLPPGKADDFESVLPPSSLVVGSKKEDNEDDPFEGHKWGGLPVFRDKLSPVHLDAADILLDMGYRHVLQLCPPAEKDRAFDVAWPLGQNVFHLFYKPGPDDGQVKVFWS